MSKIKVCHIITKLELGGAQQNTLYTVGHLDADKFERQLIAGRGGILDKEAKTIEEATVRFAPGLIRQTYPWADAAGFFALISLLRELRPDIVHTHSSKAGILGRWAARLAGVPVIIHTFHGFGFHEFQPWPVRMLFVLLEKITAPLSTRLIAVSADNVEKALAHGIGKRSQYLVIRSGIHLNSYNARPASPEKKREFCIPQDARVILTVGPFKPQKNLRDFIEVARRVRERRKNSFDVFLVVGDGTQRPELESLIAANKLQDSVKLLGWRRDIPDLFGITDVFVMTSLWEGLPRSILEAMSSGLPVIANAVDGVKEVVQDGVTGYLVKPYDVGTMTERLLSLLDRPDLAKQMGEQGKKSIDRQYDIDYMVRQQEELYTNLLENK